MENLIVSILIFLSPPGAREIKVKHVEELNGHLIVYVMGDNSIARKGYYFGRNGREILKSL